MIINSINQLIKCLLFPFFFLLVLSLVLLLFYDKKKGLFFLAVFSFILFWRSFMWISSSRYFAAFFVFLFITASTLFKAIAVIKNKSELHIIVLFALFLLGCYNIIQTNSSFRNTFIFDLQDDIYSFLSHDNTTVFIDKKDYMRVNVNHDLKKRLIKLPDESRIKSSDILNKYRWWNEDLFVAFCVSNNDNILSFPQLPPYIHTKNIRQYISNKARSKKYIVMKGVSNLHPNMDFFLTNNAHDSVLSDILFNGTLVALYPPDKLYVFQYKDKLYWFVDKTTNEGFEIIFHIYTNNISLLPDSRKKFCFYNKGFIISQTKPLAEFGQYYLFSQTIPCDDKITKIVTGISDKGNIKWNHIIFDTNSDF